MLLSGLSSENTLWISPPFFVRLLVLPYDLIIRASQVALVVKNLPTNTGDVRDSGSILGSGRSPEGGHGNPLQYSCELEQTLGDSGGQGSLTCCSPWGCKDSDMT